MAPANFPEFKARFEQIPEWASPLPTPVKGDNGSRFATGVDVPVAEHVPGATAVAMPRQKAKRPARVEGPPPAPLPLDPEMVARLVAFVLEREAIRLRREAGESPPWTEDPILAEGRFCNVHREHDRVTRWVSENIVGPHRDDPDLWHKLTIVRCCSNRPEALAEYDWSSPFDAKAYLAKIEALLADGKKVFHKAYRLVIPPRELKGITYEQYYANYFLSSLWRDREQVRPRVGDTLASFANRLCEYERFGPFFAAQVVADLKSVGPLSDASDWWTFARIGPGSDRGLNRVCKREVTASWSEASWHATLMHLHTEIADRLAAAGIAALDLQNTQSCLCEFHKYERDRETGKTSRPYKPAGAPARSRKKSAPKLVTTSSPPQNDTAVERERDESAQNSPTISADAEKSATSRIPTGPPSDDKIPDHVLVDIAPARAEAPPPKSETKFADSPPPGDTNRKANSGYPHGERDTGTKEALYIYLDARGRHYLGVQRTSTKQFPQFHWNGTQWIKGLPKGFVKIPYRLPELLDAPADAWVVIAAGEKDTETAARLGFVATTNSGGEGKGQWTPELNRWFAGKQRVAVMEDNDVAGYAHALGVANALRGIVPDIRIVSFRELQKGGDLTDWIEADRTRGYAELLARIESSPAPTSYELVRASTIQMRAVQWWWPGHLARGELEILTGVPDIGKSQVHCSYIAHMTTGRDWPDKAKGPPASDVVMLTAEDNTAHTVCPRLVAAGANLDRVLILNKIRKDNRNRMFLLQEDLDVLEHILTGDPAIGLVTIDPITAYLGGKLDSHRATDVRNQLGPLKELAERCNVAFSAITHPAKRPGAKALDHYIGSQAFIAAPRIGHICIWEVEESESGQPRPTGRALFATPKHNIYFAMPTLAYRLVMVDGGVDTETGTPISVSRVEWAEEVPLSADQAIAAATPIAAKASSNVVAFLFDILANGPVAKTIILERAAVRGFTEEQLRRARTKAGIGTYKETGKKSGRSFWALASHMPTGQRQEDDEP